MVVPQKNLFNDKVVIPFGNLPDGQHVSIGLGLFAWLLVDDSPQAKSNLGVALFKQNEMNTLVSPGQMVYTRQGKKGWWLQQVDVEMWFDEGYTLKLSQPTAINADGTTASTVNWDVSGNVGVFGDAPTANVGVVSGGSNSITHSFSDFTLQDRTDPVANRLSHSWQLTFDPEGGNDSFEGAFRHGIVKEPPTSAVSDFLLIEQGMWAIPYGAKSGTLNIRFSLQFKAVEASNEFFYIEYRTYGHHYDITRKWMLNF